MTAHSRARAAYVHGDPSPRPGGAMTTPENDRLHAAATRTTRQRA